MSTSRYLVATLLAALVAAPAPAQRAGPPTPDAPRTAPVSGDGEVSREAPVNGVLTLYGNQRCPTDNDGNEIVVCQRRNAGEQFRVPKELRELQVTPANQSWAARAQATLDEGVGASSIGSCSTIGAGGATGCLARNIRRSRSENSDRATASTAILP